MNLKEIVNAYIDNLPRPSYCDRGSGALLAARWGRASSPAVDFRVCPRGAEASRASESQKLERAADFGALHDVVEFEIGAIRGIGPLAVYDIAHRLGAFLRRSPEFVYLHAGTKRGAAVFNLRGWAIRREQLPAAFSRLSAAEIEDCLCTTLATTFGRFGLSRNPLKHWRFVQIEDRC